MMAFNEYQVLVLMHLNTARSLKQIADYSEQYKISRAELISTMIHISEVLTAQAEVVRMKEELNIE